MIWLIHGLNSRFILSLNAGNPKCDVSRWVLARNVPAALRRIHTCGELVQKHRGRAAGVEDHRGVVPRKGLQNETPYVKSHHW